MGADDELRRENAKLRARLDDRAKRDAMQPLLARFRPEAHDMVSTALAGRITVKDDGTTDAESVVDAYLKQQPALAADRQPAERQRVPASDRHPPSIRDVVVAELMKQQQGGGS